MRGLGSAFGFEEGKKDMIRNVPLISNVRRTSNACSPGLLLVSSTITSYFVRGKCWCSNESKAPYTVSLSAQIKIHACRSARLTHSQLIAISASSGKPRCLIFGMFPI